MNIIGIECSVSELGKRAELDRTKNPIWQYVGTDPIPSERITVGTYGKLGRDKIRYVALPDGVTVDITPRVEATDHYRFDVSPTKYELDDIFVNDCAKLLESDRVIPEASYCVGQKLKFEAQFATPPPGLKSTRIDWRHSGDYVNNYWTVWNNCTRYNIAAGPSSSNPSVAWFYNQKTEDVTSTVGYTCIFKNGQSVYFERHGKINVFAPSTVFNSPSRLYDVAAYYATALLPSPALGLAGEDFEIGNLGMEFSCRITSKTGFAGKGKVTQLINSQNYVNKLPIPPPFQTFGETYLDNCDPYPKSLKDVDGDHIGNVVPLIDEPSIPLVGALTASCNFRFNTYIRFKPNGDPDNIYVTLARVDWGFHGDTVYHIIPGIGYNPWYLPSWVVSNPGRSGPDFHQVNEFPIWNGIASNWK